MSGSLGLESCDGERIRHRLIAFIPGRGCPICELLRAANKIDAATEEDIKREA